MTNENILGVDFSTFALDSTVVHNTGNESISGVKGFTEINSGLIGCGAAYFSSSASISSTESIYNSTATIVDTDLLHKTIKCNPTSDIVLTLPTASAFATVFNGSPPINTAIESIYIVNNSSTSTVTIAVNTGFDVNGAPSVLIPPLGVMVAKAAKLSTTPTFRLYAIVTSTPVITGVPLLAANNVFTGQTNEFNTVNTTFSNVNGPEAVSSFSLSPMVDSQYQNNSQTISAFDLANRLVQFIATTGSTQSIFMPLGSNMETTLLTPFPSGYSIAVGMSFPVILQNLMPLITVTLNANTNFAIVCANANKTIAGIGGNSSRNGWVVKTGSSPAAYTLYI